MKSLDFQLKKVQIPKAISHLLKSFDFIVGSFQWPGGKAIEIIVRKDA
uniref:Uncharacterized protein n=1 Tax=Candidatus Kentrum sp. TUN TaxID=2126343 RepID=A0A451B2B1_9GAMM|nr:MAG: hypothetical protein BECKTUN1418E_GA0071001_14072 [Candidatus Kentron sp. TUN]